VNFVGLSNGILTYQVFDFFCYFGLKYTVLCVSVVLYKLILAQLLHMHD